VKLYNMRAEAVNTASRGLTWGSNAPDSGESNMLFHRRAVPN